MVAFSRDYFNDRPPASGWEPMWIPQLKMHDADIYSVLSILQPFYWQCQVIQGENESPGGGSILAGETLFSSHVMVRTSICGCQEPHAETGRADRRPSDCAETLVI
jgi:hypothetical protein